ncbi:hypothetical protein [Engelhardtia mirabilis]|uniref:Uncharacterized protein n=1 Tax=Engelhardtia mirabilis TaxID=2528011 RepID=A0A518BT56_9BACT|nr:hypothetical protein Pla133_52780 [Planctomycetes bacterium Pla133]QDV04482.1 hypothetical protein Pla86_52780 [Planctomycetes bacterium Pla86]
MTSGTMKYTILTDSGNDGDNPAALRVELDQNAVVFVQATAIRKPGKAWFNMAIYKDGSEVASVATTVNHKHDEGKYTLLHVEELGAGSHEFQTRRSARKSAGLELGGNQGFNESSLKIWYLPGACLD